jgi:hypothetical protein
VIAIGVHQTHCCIRHYCKYGKTDCPVVTGAVVQEHPCEFCDEENDGEAAISVIERIRTALNMDTSDLISKKIILRILESK